MPNQCDHHVVAFGVYVHIPFCATRCDYCDFATWTDRSHLIDDYVSACVTDIRRRRSSGGLQPASSLFFGGGTPSLLEPEQLARIVGAVDLEPGAEVTAECNPDSVDATKLVGYRDAGVTRISLGVQSTVPHVLESLGRTHDRGNVERACTAVRDAGIGSFNVDVIFGTPGESVDDWRTTVNDVLSLRPEHVSAYALTVESGTPLADRVTAGTSPAPDDDDQADKYRVVDEFLGAAGLAWYEISNFSLPGRESRHNSVYWSGDDYLAIGSAGHGYSAPRRWWNVRRPEDYIERVRSGRSPERGSETLPDSERAGEALMLALRTRRGVRADAVPSGPADAMVGAGLLAQADDRLVLTLEGRLVASEVTMRLVDALRVDPPGPPGANCRR